MKESLYETVFNQKELFIDNLFEYNHVRFKKRIYIRLRIS